MSTMIFHPAFLSGEADVPPAKSEAHRALLLAALGAGRCRLSGFDGPLCDDTQAMLNGVAALGGAWEREGGAVVVEPGAGRRSDLCEVKACAAALRMLIPVFWARGQAVRLRMSPALAARPLDAFVPLARALGARMEAVPCGESVCLELSGRMPAGDYEVDGAQSSQFASGLLIALSHATDGGGAPAPSTLRITGNISSRPYLDMTLRHMARFGVPAKEIAPGVFALSPGRAVNPAALRVPGDWSQAAVLLCMNALGARIAVRGLETGTQGDERVAQVLGDMGLCVSGEGGLWRAERAGDLKPVTVDCTDIPDIAPILALALTQARGRSVLRGVGRLRIKECDRLSATSELLTRLGARVSAQEDTLTIEGPTRLRGGFEADARGDHRVVMLLAAAACAADGPIAVSGAECISKSWTGFAGTYRQLGGIAL